MDNDDRFLIRVSYEKNIDSKQDSDFFFHILLHSSLTSGLLILCFILFRMIGLEEAGRFENSICFLKNILLFSAAAV